MEATQTATGHVSAAAVLAAGQEGAKAMTIAEKLIAATSKKARKAAILLLEDGTRFDGWACGAPGEVTGEICFNTSLEGYLEVITDPSYAGQIVTMTYPQIGNYGVNLDDTQSTRPALRGLVVHDMCRTPSNWRSSMSLPEFLERENIVAIEGIDTRALVRHIRDFGAQTAILSTEDLDAASLAEKVVAAPSLVGHNLAKTVSRAAAESFDKVPESQAFAVAAPAPKKYRVVAYDCGVKESILAGLVRVGCDLTVVPWDTPAADVLAMEYENDEWVNSIRDQTSRMAKLVSNLVTLSRLDEENPFPERRQFSLSDAIWETADPYGGIAAARGRTYTQQIEDGLSMTGDRSAVQQALSILLDNAVKYSPEGGSISLHAYRSGRRTIIEVSNTAPENCGDISRFFDRFYRADPSRSDVTRGTGIGLSIAKAAIDAHGGSISVKKNGEDITFTVRL